MRPTYDGKCEVCNREGIKVSKYSFKQEKEIKSYIAPYRLENPDYMEVALCGSDLQLAIAIRKRVKNITARETLAKMKEFREANPIQIKHGKNRVRVKDNHEVVTKKCKDCDSTDTRMVRHLGSDKVYFVCKIHDPERVDNIGTSFENMFDKDNR